MAAAPPPTRTRLASPEDIWVQQQKQRTTVMVNEPSLGDLFVAPTLTDTPGLQLMLRNTKYKQYDERTPGARLGHEWLFLPPICDDAKHATRNCCLLPHYRVRHEPCSTAISIVRAGWPCNTIELGPIHRPHGCSVAFCVPTTSYGLGGTE